MPTVNPEILVWARHSAGLSAEDAVAKLAIRDARGVAAVDRLRALERGEQKPTRPTLVKMAHHYRRPLLAFYLTAPPPPADRGAVFRTLTTAQPSETDAWLDALVRDIRVRQSMVRAVLEAENEATPLPFVGSTTMSAGTEAALESLQGVLGRDLDAARYSQERTAREAFALLRSAAEGSSVFVLLKGNLGSHHTAIDPKIFRGFAIADGVAPFVVINDQDAQAAWSFTLLHELVHLLLGQTGFSGTAADTEIERFCDNVAGEWLLPAQELAQLDVGRTLEFAEQQERIGGFARTHNMSNKMVAYRLLRANRIDQATFNRLCLAFGERWQRERDRRRVRARESEGGPDYFVVRRHRAGQALLRFTRRMMDSGALSTTKAAKVLGVKPTHVGTLLRTGGLP